MAQHSCRRFLVQRLQHGMLEAVECRLRMACTISAMKCALKQCQAMSLPVSLLMHIPVSQDLQEQRSPAPQRKQST